ncbi:MAG: S41 family peptidase, partial [Pseudoflavonifractor sp.]
CFVVSFPPSLAFLLEKILADSPAQAAGLEPGDVIISVDDVETAGKTATEISAMLRGEEGTQVSLTLLRGDTRRSYRLTRKTVVVAATTTELRDGHIGYIECNTFGAETEGHFVAGITANDAAADRWIVDLRKNGGGDISACVQAAGTLAGRGEFTYLRDNEGKYGAYVREKDRLTQEPVIVVVGQDTASASEIFASILRDQQTGLIIGSRTYGKGVAQTMLDKETDPTVFSDGSALKVTAYRFFSPNGTTTDRVGVIPHLLVPEELADKVALLLCAAPPEGQSKDLLRLDMGWRWYVDLNEAVKPENRSAFAALLAAIPPSVCLQRGTGGSEGWQEVAPADVARQFQVEEYTYRGFGDVEGSAYGQEIDTLATYGILRGTGDGGFHPDSGLTRGELCALLARTLDCPQTMGGKPYAGESRFTDVPVTAWYAAPVNELAALGLVDGVGKGLFRPEDPVTNQELMTVMARLIRRLSMIFHDAQPKETLDYGYLVPYDRWARLSVWTLTESQQDLYGDRLNLLWSKPEEIVPTAPAVRGETAALLYNVLSSARVITV